MHLSIRDQTIKLSHVTCIGKDTSKNCLTNNAILYTLEVSLIGENVTRIAQFLSSDHSYPGLLKGRCSNYFQLDD